MKPENIISEVWDKDDEWLVKELYFGVIPWHKVEEVVARVGGNVQAAHVVLSAIVEKVTAFPRVNNSWGSRRKHFDATFCSEGAVRSHAESLKTQPAGKIEGWPAGLSC